MRLSPNEIAHVASSVWLKPEDALIAVAVAWAESGGDTEALGLVTPTTNAPGSGNVDHGLWQISNLWNGNKMVEDPDWRNPYVNAVLAYQVWGAQGWAGWSVYKSGTYLRWMPTAKVAMRYPIPPPNTSHPMTVVLNGALHLEGQAQ